MSKLTFIIDGEIADVSESVEFTSIYRGADNLDEKKNNYSLTVKFPFTYKNELLFKRTNALSYKSDFPYQQHRVDILSNGISLVVNGKLNILSTTDSFECGITWDNVDYTGIVINNDTKLGVLLKDFPILPWNYEYDNTVIYDDVYNSTRALTYGYIRYNDGGGEFGGSLTHFYSYCHPLINFKYLLEQVFAELGITVNIPTAKLNFLQDLILRPNKELDQKYNNVFQAAVRYGDDLVRNVYALQLDYRYDGQEGIGSQAFGNNSYYFKSWINTTNGIYDVLNINYNDLGHIPQSKRFKAFTTTTYNEMVVTNFNVTTGSNPIFIRWNSASLDFTVLHTILGDGTYTFSANEGDYLFFHVPTPGDQSMDIEIVSEVDENLTTPNNLFFPSLYHIPTNIDLTAGELIQEALILTGSVLSYNVATNEYSFIENVQENSTAYDVTDNLVSIKEIKYDTKYLYSKFGQSNYFRYLNNTPIDADLNYSASNTNLVLEKDFAQSKLSPSAIQASGYYDGFSIASEHSFPATEVWTQFTEQPLHILYNDSALSKIRFTSEIDWTSIFNLFYSSYFIDLESLILTGTIRLIKFNASMSDVIFKRINTKGLVYIRTFAKYYSIIEIVKKGDECEFFVLELA